MTEGERRKRALTFKNESNMSITFMNGNYISYLDINDYSSEINNSSKCIKNKEDVCSRNRICRGKATSITYHERVSVDLATMHCTCTILYCHLWPVRLYNLFALSHKRQDFRKKLLNIQCAY